MCLSALTERVRDVAAGRKGAVSGRFVSRSLDEKSKKKKKRINERIQKRAAVTERLEFGVINQRKVCFEFIYFYFSASFVST